MDRQERRPPLGPLERAVMDVLWQAGDPMTVRQVLEALNSDRQPPLAYTTVMTVMTRLAERQVLQRTQAGRGFRYQPAAASPAEIAVAEVLHDFGDAALVSFVDRVTGNQELRDRLRRLVEEER
jgi:predicted transcriptional regulator